MSPPLRRIAPRPDWSYNPQGNSRITVEWVRYSLDVHVPGAGRAGRATAFHAPSCCGEAGSAYPPWRTQAGPHAAVPFVYADPPGMSCGERAAGDPRDHRSARSARHWLAAPRQTIRFHKRADNRVAVRPRAVSRLHETAQPGQEVRLSGGTHTAS